LHEREAGMSREHRESLDDERDPGRLEAWSDDPGLIAGARCLLSGLARDWLLGVSQFSVLVCEHPEQRFSDRRECDASASVEGMCSTTSLLPLPALGVLQREGGMKRGDTCGRGTRLECTPHGCVCLAADRGIAAWHQI
jgi:hypothetical protein